MASSHQFKGGQRFNYVYHERRIVGAQVVRDIFNDNFYYDRATVLKEFEQFLVYQDSASEFYGQVTGTVSEVVIYHKAFNFVAEVHMFVSPETDDDDDPELGASRRADPKELIHDDDVYYVADLPRKPPFLDRPRRRR